MSDIGECMNKLGLRPSGASLLWERLSRVIATEKGVLYVGRQADYFIIGVTVPVDEVLEAQKDGPFSSALTQYERVTHRREP